VVNSGLTLAAGAMLTTDNDFVADSGTITVYPGTQIQALNCLSVTNSTLVLDASSSSGDEPVVFSSLGNCARGSFSEVNVINAPCKMATQQCGLLCTFSDSLTSDLI